MRPNFTLSGNQQSGPSMTESRWDLRSEGSMGTSSMMKMTLDVESIIEFCTKKLEENPGHPKALTMRASALLKKSMPEEARADCDALLLLQPDNAGVYYTRGICSEKMGQLDQAVKDFSHCLELNPNHYNAAYAKGSCECKRGNYEQSIHDYTLAFEKDNNSSKTLFVDPKFLKRSSSVTTLQKFRTSGFFSIAPLDLINKMHDDLNLSPVHKPIRAVAGGHKSRISLMPIEEKESCQRVEADIFFRGSEIPPSSIQIPGIESAIEHSRVSLISSESSSQSPKMSGKQKNETEKIMSLASEYKKQGNYAEAVRYYTKALIITPRLYRAYFNRAFCFYRLKSYEESIKDYTKVIKMTRKRQIPHQLINSIAFSSTLSVIELKSLNAYAYYNRGISYDKLHQFDSAISDFTKAIALSPSKSDFFHNRGFSLMKKGDFDKAIEDFSNALILNPIHFKACYNRGLCYDKKLLFEKAEADLNKAVELCPSSMEALHFLASIQEKIGGEKLRFALINFEKVLKLNPLYTPALNGRGLVYEKQGKLEEAIADYNKVGLLLLNLQKKERIKNQFFFWKFKP